MAEEGSPPATPGQSSQVTKDAVASADDRDSSLGPSVQIFSGHALAAQEGNALAAVSPTRVIAFVGPTKSGKTTLILSLYEAFRQGKFGSCLFAGSRTLLAYEERCHLSRAASELSKPDTERSRADAEDVLLHLRVRPDPLNDRRIVSFLFFDISGELFEAAGESTAALLQIPFLSHAYRVVMFVDGDKLADLAARHATRQDFLTLLRAGIESGRFHPKTSIDVVFTKQDIVRAHAQRTEIERFQAEIEETCHKRFSSQVHSLNFHRVASRPHPDEGLTDLFRTWTERDSFHFEPLLPKLDPRMRRIDAFGATETLRRAQGMPNE
jgi:hypothetical protein